MPLHLPTLGVLESDVPRVIGRVVAISSAIGMPFMPLWGALADRYARQPVIVRSFIFYLLSIIIMMLAGDLWIFVIGRALMSFTMGNTGLMLTTLTEKSPPHRISLIFSIVEGAIPVGIALAHEKDSALRVLSPFDRTSILVWASASATATRRSSRGARRVVALPHSWLRRRGIVEWIRLREPALQ